MNLKVNVGRHKPGSGHACVMEYVSILSGEPFTDTPACTDSVLAAAARSVNDWLSDDERDEMTAFIPRLVGTSRYSSDKLSDELTDFIHEYVRSCIASDDDTDCDLLAYMTAIIDKFDELTGHISAELTEADLELLSSAVSGTL